MIPQSESRPDWVKRIVAMGPNVAGAEHLVSLDPAELVATARRSTGLADFGAPSWEEPFERLLTAINGEARLHVLGRLMTRNDLLRHLQTRLKVVDAVGADPAITDQQVSAPLVITGPARSGTSILHELLGEDPSLRAPRGWEMAHPFPPPAGEPDERAAWAESEFDLWADVNPAFAAVHELRAALPEECLWLFAPEFDSGFWATCTNVPSFLMWRAMSDPLPGYRWHKLMLQVLQQVAALPARPWVLKSPMHLGRLPALFAIYPDARVIRTHRDPVRTVPSSISTIIAGRGVRSDHVDPQASTAGMAFGLQYLLTTMREQRDQLPAGQVADLQYLDLLHDPVQAIAGAYEQLGMTFDAQMPQRITAYLAARPQDKHGSHRYSAEEFGLDPAQIRADFAPYTEAFNVPAE